MEAILTKHAIERMKDRVGIPRKAAQRLADKALNEGIPHKNTKSKLHRYISKVHMEYKKADNIRILAQHIYLFKGRVLITVFHLPKTMCGMYK